MGQLRVVHGTSGASGASGVVVRVAHGEVSDGLPTLPAMGRGAGWVAYPAGARWSAPPALGAREMPSLCCDPVPPPR